MILVIITLIISFLLDGLISNYIPVLLNNINIFYPMFTIVSLVLIYPYFNNDEFNYYKVVILVGLFYDIIYTNSFPLNIFVFFILAFIVKRVNLYLSNNYINVIIMSLLLIMSFELCNFIILNIIGYTSISISELFYKIYNSCLLNSTYALFSYYILTIISRKYKIRRID